MVVSRLERTDAKAGNDPGGPLASFTAGDWTVEPRLNALRRGAVEHHVEPKVMQVLVVLASGGNRVFTKEELIAAVWPDTFVSDDVLTRCISILRRVTHDSPQAPRFIQTVPKVGYRLVAEVRPVARLADPRPKAPQPAAPEAEKGELRSDAIPDAMLPQPAMAIPAQVPQREWRRRDWVPGAVWTLLLLIAVGVAGGLWWRGSRERTAGETGFAMGAFRTAEFTSVAGEQVQPAFSPDGSWVAYVRVPEDGGPRRIFLKRAEGGEARELVAGGKEEQFSPAWAPDGKRIAFLGRGPEGLGLYVAVVGAGTAGVQQVYRPDVASHWEQGAVSWAPDGRSLVFPDHRGGSTGASLMELELGTGTVRRLTTAPTGWEGDLTPAWSPDGKWIAFTRASETAVRNVFRLRVEDGSIKQMTQDGSDIDSLAWSRDGRWVFFSSNRGGKYALWRVGTGGGEPQRLPFGTEDAFQPAVGPLPGQFAYAQGSAVWSIDRLGEGEHGARSVVSSTQQDSAPALSPNGQSFAFQSRRSGNQEIWVCGVDGAGLRELTTMDGPVTGSPAWSYDGRTIAFDSRPDGHSHIFAVDATGGAVRQLTSGENNDIVPRWSRDGETVYFRSNRGGQWRLWSLRMRSGVAKPLTVGDGIAAQESVDRSWLFFARGDGPGLWRVPVDGGRETEVFPEPAAGFWGYFDVAPEGVYYLDRRWQPGEVRLWEPESGRTHAVATLLGTAPQLQGMSVGANGAVVLIGRERDPSRHITLVTRR